MTRTLTPAPAERLTAVLSGVLGTGWTPPVSTEWPAAFTNEAEGWQLTVYPDRRNDRLVLIVGPVDGADDFAHQRFGKYTPDLTGHDTIDGWLTDGDLDAVADALATILQRLVDQPLPARVADTNPLDTQRQQLAEHARELAAHASHFAADLIWAQPVADAARRLVSLAQTTAHTATRVDELRGYNGTRRDPGHPAPPGPRPDQTRHEGELETTGDTADHASGEIIHYTADVAAVTPDGHVLLIERGWPPYEGAWALPGGHVDPGETSRVAAARELFEETGVHVDESALRQLGTFDRPDRDPRGRYVTVAYLAEVAADTPIAAGDDARTARWWPLSALPDLAFDHTDILSDLAGPTS